MVTMISLQFFVMFGSMTCLLSLSHGQILSRNKTVTMSSTHSNWTASRAVNGDYRTNADVCQCCAATTEELNPWLQVDLGDTYTVTRILVYSRSDNYLDKQNITGLIIHMDNQQAFYPPSNKWYQYDTFFNYNFTIPISTRNVTLTVPGVRHLVVCEVDIIYDKIISTSKMVTMDSVFEGTWSANRTVDGDWRTNAGPCGCCAATIYKSSSWLRVDLGAQYVIYYVMIYGRTDGTYKGQSFEGMSIEFDNREVKRIPHSSRAKNTTKFFEFRSDTTTSVKTVNLALYSSNFVPETQLVVCEVVIYGACPAGRYGADCSGECGSCKENEPCNFTNGVCKKCEDGYIETNMLCKERCQDGLYGNNCSSECGFCRGKEACNFKTGVCKECEDGYKETNMLCKDLCEDGTYGQNCTMTCGHCRHGESCNQMTGKCVQCEDGYKETDLFCTELCPYGTHGINCSQECGQCRNNRSCNQTNGLCEQCEDGYTETNLLCTELCPDGTYGFNCTNTCGQCKDKQSCNQTDGLCEQCEEGYMETNLKCTELCPNGTYGHNCTNTCGHCKDNKSCIQTNGLCEHCQDGFTETNLKCTERCHNGTYGHNCTKPCGQCKNNATCNQTNGLCEHCEDGYRETDMMCTEKCPDGRYGPNCSGICGRCAKNITCNKRTGSCDDCYNGYYLTDSMCQNECRDGTFGRNCTGKCGGCMNGTCGKYDGLCEACAEGFDDKDPYCKTKTEAVEKSPVGVIAGTVCSVIVLTSVAVGVIVYLKRRGFILKKKKEDLNRNESEWTRQNPEYENNYFEPETTTATNNVREGEGEYINVRRTPDVRIVNLWNYIYRQKRNNAESLKSQYDEFGSELLYPTDDAIKYRDKVRYKDMAPYDYTRVHLKVEEEDECEFINASHIDGFDRQGKFIAAQGPMKANVIDFWRMVWQYNISKIVMLTNPVEMAAVKCIEYWPDEGEVTYEKIKIVLLQEESRDDFIVRTFRIHKPEGTPKQVRQFHYRVWPDKDVPHSAWSLVNFWREAMKDDDKSSPPIVVHCSAGVGRTGTFIALDNLYNQAKQKGPVNPVEIVSNLRNQRQKMVQTRDQYVYLHDAVAEALMIGTHHIPEEKFKHYYSYMMQNDSSTKKLNLHKQYLLLLDGLRHFEQDEQADGATSNAESDEYKPKLQTKVLAKKLTSVQNYEGKEVLILTTSRKEDNFEEFWRLVDQTDIKSVVTLAETGERDERLVVSQHGRYHPELVSEEADTKCTVRTFTYKKQQTSKSSLNKDEVKQFVLWFDKSGFPDKDSVLKMLQDVFKWQYKLSDSQPLLIQCRDITTQPGIMCVLLNEVDRMLNQNGHINILESITLIKRKMPGFISTFEQYRFIHDVLHQMVITKEDQVNIETADETEIYVNVQT